MNEKVRDLQNKIFDKFGVKVDVNDPIFDFLQAELAVVDRLEAMMKEGGSCAEELKKIRDTLGIGLVGYQKQIEKIVNDNQKNTKKILEVDIKNHINLRFQELVKKIFSFLAIGFVALGVVLIIAVKIFSH